MVNIICLWYIYIIKKIFIFIIKVVWFIWKFLKIKIILLVYNGVCVFYDKNGLYKLDLCMCKING